MSKIILNLPHDIGEILTREELTSVIGGTGSASSGYTGSTICAATRDWTQPFESCFANADQAMQYAGRFGNWSCNTPEAIDFCK